VPEIVLSTLPPEAGESMEPPIPPLLLAWINGWPGWKSKRRIGGSPGRPTVAFRELMALEIDQVLRFDYLSTAPSRLLTEILL